jgi:hypothetical protein
MTHITNERSEAGKAPQIGDRFGGPEGIRTPDLMTASHARSQLRHRPRKKLSGISYQRKETYNLAASVKCKVLNAQPSF